MRFQGPRPAILPRSCPGARALASMEAGAVGLGDLAGLGDPKGLLGRPRIKPNLAEPWMDVDCTLSTPNSRPATPSPPTLNPHSLASPRPAPRGTLRLPIDC